MTETFDANRRMAEVALWIDGTARWLDHAVEPARSTAPAGGRHRISLTFDREELELLVSGLRGVARTLMGWPSLSRHLCRRLRRRTAICASSGDRLRARIETAHGRNIGSERARLLRKRRACIARPRQSPSGALGSPWTRRRWFFPCRAVAGLYGAWLGS